MTDQDQAPEPVEQPADAPAADPAPEVVAEPEAAPAPVSEAPPAPVSASVAEVASVSAPVAEIPAEALSPAAEVTPPTAVEPIPEDFTITVTETETIVVHNLNALRGVQAGPDPHPRAL